MWKPASWKKTTVHPIYTQFSIYPVQGNILLTCNISIYISLPSYWLIPWCDLDVTGGPSHRSEHVVKSRHLPRECLRTCIVYPQTSVTLGVGVSSRTTFALMRRSVCRGRSTTTMISRFEHSGSWNRRAWGYIYGSFLRVKEEGQLDG